MRQQNNLKQIGSAVHNDHDRAGAFPGAELVWNFSSFSALTHFLPNLEQSSRSNAIDFLRPDRHRPCH